MKPFIIILSLVLLSSCAEKKQPLSAQTIVDKAIERACSGNCEHAKIDFTFRDRCYISRRKGSEFSYERITSDSTGVTHDVLNNMAFLRHKNDTLIVVADSMITKYSNSINSVHYFAQLPFGLNAPAAVKELLGESIIEAEPYYVIGVSFTEENVGTDFEDTFVYWIHKENFTVDYLAYEYAVDGGGIRFREAYNPRVVNGIRFVDYNNYKPKDLKIPLRELGKLYEEGALKLLSKIETESVGVQLLNSN